MIWLKSIIVGIVAALISAVVVGVWQTRWWFDVGEGTGSIGAISTSILEPLLAAIVGFSIGFLWTLRRSRKELRLTAAGDRSG